MGKIHLNIIRASEVEVKILTLLDKGFINLLFELLDNFINFKTHREKSVVWVLETISRRWTFIESRTEVADATKNSNARISFQYPRTIFTGFQRGVE